MARILTVTPNPAIDVTYRVAHQVIGETVRVSDVRRIPGGKGINVARVLLALGREASTLQPLGGDGGTWMARELAGLGIPAHACAIEGETRTTVAVVDDDSHPTLLAEPGPTLSDDDWSRLAAAAGAALAAGDWMVVAGSFPPRSSAPHIARLIDSAHARGARVLVDTSGPLLRAAADAGADVVKANEQEVREATRIADAAAAIAVLAHRGATVMISRGSDGAVLHLPDGSEHVQAAVPGVSGNPTGAGDAATAGLVAALAEGRDEATALAWAAVCGAAAVLSPVAGDIDITHLPPLASRLGDPSAHPLSSPSDRRTS